MIIFRVIRQNNDPFGGIQLILCGDFLQLPPVTKRGEKRKFAFQVLQDVLEISHDVYDVIYPAYLGGWGVGWVGLL